MNRYAAVSPFLTFPCLVLLAHSPVSGQVPPPGARVFDTFTSEPTVLSAHYPEVRPAGAVWTQLDGSAMPTLNNGQLISTGADGYVISAIDSGVADGGVAIDFTSSASIQYGGLVFRALDSSRMLLLRYWGDATGGEFELFRRIDGEFVRLNGVALSPSAAGSTHRIEVRLAGASIRAVWDGVVVMAMTVADYQTATTHGVLWHVPSDPTGAFDNFHVVGPNTGPPLVTGPSTQYSAEGSDVYVQTTAIDPDGAPLSYSATGLPAGLSINGTTGAVTGIPAFASQGTYTVTIQVSDGFSHSTKTIAWTVGLPARPSPRVPDAVAVFDTFGGGAGPLPSRAPDVRPRDATWVQLDGAQAPIVQNQEAGANGSGYAIAVIDSGVNNGTISADVLSRRDVKGTQYSGIAFRALDANRMLLLVLHTTSTAGHLTLFRRNAGEFYQLWTNRVPPLAAGEWHRLEAQVEGELVTARLDGVTVFEWAAVPAYETATKHGLLWHVGTDPTAVFDNFSVTAVGPQCVPMVDPLRIERGPDNQTGSVLVSAPADCAWTASSRTNFVQLNRSGGTGAGTISYSIDNNTAPEPRDARLFIAGRLVTLVQAEAAPSSACTYGAVLSTNDFPAEGGAGHIDVSTRPDCTWTAESHGLTVRMTQEAGTIGDGAVAFVVEPNPAAVRRRTHVTVAGHQLLIVQQANASMPAPAATPPSTPPDLGGWFGFDERNVNSCLGNCGSGCSSSMDIRLPNPCKGTQWLEFIPSTPPALYAHEWREHCRGVVVERLRYDTYRAEGEWVYHGTVTDDCLRHDLYCRIAGKWACFETALDFGQLTCSNASAAEWRYFGVAYSEDRLPRQSELTDERCEILP